MKKNSRIVATLIAIIVTVSLTGQEPFFNQYNKYPDSDNLTEELFKEISDLGTTYTSKGDLRGIEECIEIMSGLNHYNLEINNGIIRAQKGVIDYYSKNNISALSNYLTSLNIFTKSGYSEGLVNVLNNIAIIFVHINDYEMANKYLYKALGYTELNDKARSLILLNISEIEILSGNYDISLEIAKNLYNQYNSEEVEYNLISVVGILIRSYNSIGDYESALEWISRVTDSMLIEAGYIDLISYFPNAMKTYFELGNYKKVAELGEFIYPPPISDFLPDLHDAINMLADVAILTKDFSKASEYEDILLELEFSGSSIDRQELIELLMKDYAFNLDMLARTNIEKEIFFNNEKHDILNKLIIVLLIIIVSLSTVSLLLLRLRKTRRVLKKRLAEENNKLAQINRDLSSSNSLLEKENALLDTLIAVFAHDLINPFQAILGFSRLMISDYENIEEESIKEYTSMLSDTSFQLSQLLINLKNMAVIQDEDRQMESFSFKVDPIISDIITLFAPAAKKKNIRVQYRSNVDINANFNPDILKSLIRNILSNSIKFSHPDGIIEIETTESNGNLIISIRDYGVGMSEETINKLVSKEFLMSNPGTLQERGSGLGLAISIELLELYKGKLQIVSKIGEGSTLSIYIPADHE